MRDRSSCVDLGRETRPDATRIWWLVVVLGTAASTLVVGTAAPLASIVERRDLGPWLRAVRPLDTHHPALVVVFLLLLSGLWVVGALLLRRGRVAGSAWGLALWATPYVLGPPLFSRDVFAYLAQGQLVQRGLDPYRTPVFALGRHAPAVLATDSEWRHTLTPYGPLGLRLEQAVTVLSGGHELRALVLLRLVALASIALTCFVVGRMVRPSHLGVWLVLSPLVLVHEVGGAHLDALVCALVATAMLLLRRGSGFAAVVVAVIAADVKASAGVLLVVLVFSVRPLWKAAGVAVLTQLVVCATYPEDPFGWLRALRVAAGSLSPGTLLVRQANRRLFHLGLTAQERAVVTTHHVLVVAGVVLAIWFLVTRARRDVPATAALLLLTTLVCGPALWGWYVGPALVLLVLSTEPWARRVLLLVATGAVFIGVPVRGRSGVIGLVAELTTFMAVAGVVFVGRTSQPPLLETGGLPGGSSLPVTCAPEGLPGSPA